MSDGWRPYAQQSAKKIGEVKVSDGWEILSRNLLGKGPFTGLSKFDIIYKQVSWRSDSNSGICKTAVFTKKCMACWQ